MRLARIGTEELPAVKGFLEAHIESSLFLLSNLETAGLEDRGEAHHATYVAAFDDAGTVSSVAASCWNGMVLVQGDAGVEEAAREAVEQTGREVRGISGPWPTVVRTWHALGLVDASTAHGDAEELFALDLSELRIPEQLASGSLACRPPRDWEIEKTLVDWRVDYMVETLGMLRSSQLREQARSELAQLESRGHHWVLAEGDRLVSYAAFSAWTRGVVQLGGVWTPHELRSCGYGRAVVAGALFEARERGAARSILFTEQSNVAAQRAYGELGFHRVGQYGLLLLR